MESGFEPGPDGGYVCHICRCLVRAGESDRRVHLQWHDSLKAH